MFYLTSPKHSLENIVDNFLNFSLFEGQKEESNNRLVWRPSSDILETKDNYQINIEIPGISKENFDIEVNDHLLTVKGERKSDVVEEGEKYYRRERLFGTFQRNYQLPDNVDTSNVKAAYNNGVLNLTIPKKAVSEAKKIAIEA